MAFLFSSTTDIHDVDRPQLCVRSAQSITAITQTVKVAAVAMAIPGDRLAPSRETAHSGTLAQG